VVVVVVVVMMMMMMTEATIMNIIHTDMRKQEIQDKFSV
jgi:hypothetical protein